VNRRFMFDCGKCCFEIHSYLCSSGFVEILLKVMNIATRYNMHGYHTADDAVAGGVGQEGRRDCSEGFARLLQPVQPQGLHTAPNVCPVGAYDVFQDRPSRHSGDGRRVVGPATVLGADKGSTPFVPLQGAAAPVKKSPYQQLMDAVFAQACQDQFIETRPEASIDSTGLDAGSRSSHYAWRTGQKRYSLRRWPKLTLACHNLTHLLIDVIVSDGPSQDAPFFGRILRKAQQRLPLDSVLADAGYDAERNHALAREELGIRSSVIALNRRGGRRWAKTRYRRQMYRRFHYRKYRHRSQIESVISRFKRRLTSSLRGRSRQTQCHEIHLRVLTHDLLLLSG
jgi:hypothetical protein